MRRSIKNLTIGYHLKSIFASIPAAWKPATNGRREGDAPISWAGERDEERQRERDEIRMPRKYREHNNQK